MEMDGLKRKRDGVVTISRVTRGSSTTSSTALLRIGRNTVVRVSKVIGRRNARSRENRRGVLEVWTGSERRLLCGLVVWT